MNAEHVMLAHIRKYQEKLIEGRTENIVIRSPKVDINGIENTQQWKTPRNPIDNDLFSVRGKLVDDGTQEEKVN
jgi:hypothetical protein